MRLRPELEERRLDPERLDPERLDPERLDPERLDDERFAVDRLPPERLDAERFAVDRRPEDALFVREDAETFRGFVLRPVVTTRPSFSAFLAAVFCALDAPLRVSLSAFSRSLSTAPPPFPSSLRSSFRASSAVSIDLVNRFHDFAPALDALERLPLRPPVLRVAISFSSLGLRATRS